eukprot:6201564-Pleurochrysis_carterae.AAC.1
MFDISLECHGPLRSPCDSVLGVLRCHQLRQAMLSSTKYSKVNALTLGVAAGSRFMILTVHLHVVQIPPGETNWHTPVRRGVHVAFTACIPRAHRSLWAMFCGGTSIMLG